jgi:hypothetical protein
MYALIGAAKLNGGDFVLLTEQLIPRRDTIESRHKDVADDDVRLQARRGQDEFLTIAHSSDNLESPAKELNDRTRHRGVVVRNQYAQ